MNDTVVSRLGAYAQVRVREPMGDRTLGETITVGGPGADVVVPGVESGAALSIQRHKGVWLCECADGARVRFNGRPLGHPRDLRRDDVLTVGDAQLIVTDVSRTLLRLDVCHLAGNSTIAPAAALAAWVPGEEGDEDLEIRPAVATHSATPVTRRTRHRWLIGGVAAAILLIVGSVASLLQSVSLDIRPIDARVQTPDTLIAIRADDRLLVLPGKHVFRAERDGYVAAQTDIVVRTDDTRATVHLRLGKLPGKLYVDTNGVAAAVSVDGVVVGRAPGIIKVAAGERTLTLRAPRFVDYTTIVAVQGAGARQDLTVRLQPSWGTLDIASIPAGARISIDGIDSGVTPAAISVPSGVRNVRIFAAGWKPWEHSVVVKAGDTLSIRPITLGQPDAHLTLRSEPAGADVTIAGIHRGQTPLHVDLPAGIAQLIVVSAAGYATWTQSITADAGRKLALSAQLEPVSARVTVQGDPPDAELLIDGAPRGHTPQSLDLQAMEHRIEVRKRGYQPFSGTVSPDAGLERTVQYHLMPTDRSKELLETAPTITSAIGYELKIVPAGTFQMGSDRREPGRRPNEGFRAVALQRPYYIGMTEITNGQFGRFRPDHGSGYIQGHSMDLDDQPVTEVTWDDAVEFCNWLSQQEGLPPAYEKRNDRYVLRRPVTTGYRLPTEAEWEYAARYAGPGRLYRFTWGDSLPVPEQVGNIAGAETGHALAATLPGYRDDYPLVAPVGKFHPNALGLHDLTGNVSEWINDSYLSYVEPDAATDPLGPDDGKRHVIRGANWKSATVAELRLAWRDGADEMSSTIGFRIARYAE
jgi:formylglycine-generating enzyme required for sulfatase activity